MPRHHSDTSVDPMLPKTPIEINGQTYFLCFDYRALREAERAFMVEGHRAALVAYLHDPFSLDAVSSILPCALYRFHPEITWEQAQEMIDLNNVSLIADAIWKAKEAAMPKPKENTEEEAPNTNPTVL